jgi:hypothetical protein
MKGMDMKHRVSIVSFLLCLLWGSAMAQPAPPAKTTPAPAAVTQTFTAAEQQRLAYCVPFAVNAYVIAAYKLHGDPIDVPKKLFAANPAANVLLPMVATIYSDTVIDAWSYAGAFYQDCAVQLAKFAPARAMYAEPCMYSSIIAATARTARAAGTPKQKVYALYASHGPEARRIIDGIYAPPTVPAEGTELQVFSTCMAPLMAKE